MSFYLDTSVIVPLHVKERRTPVLWDWVTNISEPILISDLAAAEFASAMSRLVRMGEISADNAVQIVNDFHGWRVESGLPIETLSADIRRAGELVRQPHPALLAPDAIHLATCLRLNLTLVADDANLLKIAGAVGVPSFQPA